MKNWFKVFKDKFVESKNKQRVLCISVVLILITAIGIYAYESTFYYQVSFNDKEIGIVQEEYMAENALVEIRKRVSDNYGDSAYFKDDTTINKIRVSKDKLIDQNQLVDTILPTLDIYKPAAIIAVDGEERLILDTKEEAEAILDSIKNEYTEELPSEKDNATLVAISFKEDVQILSKDVLVDNILTKEEAQSEINTSTEQVQTYKVALGDNAWNISRAYDTEINTLKEANADKDIEDLMPGDTIKLVVADTFVDVASTVKQTVKEDIKYEVEKKKDSSMYSGETKVKQDGKNGKKEVTKEITYINGVVDKEKVLEEKVITEPTTKIVLEGTKKRPVSRSYSRAAAPTYNGSLGSAIVSTAKHYLGTPYRSGGSTPAGFDCSGFTQYVYRQYGISIPRTSGGQGSVGGYVSRGNLRPGDLVIFSGHVGIYVGNNSFIHSPRPGKSIMISSLSESYWSSHYRSGRRVN